MKSMGSGVSDWEFESMADHHPPQAISATNPFPQINGGFLRLSGGILPAFVAERRSPMRIWCDFGTKSLFGLS